MKEFCQSVVGGVAVIALCFPLLAAAAGTIGGDGSAQAQSIQRAISKFAQTDEAKAAAARLTNKSQSDGGSAPGGGGATKSSASAPNKPSADSGTHERAAGSANRRQ